MFPLRSKVTYNQGPVLSVPCRAEMGVHNYRVKQPPKCDRNRKNILKPGRVEALPGGWLVVSQRTGP